MTTATAALDATARTAVTAGLRVASPRQRQLPESGWFFVGHKIARALERLPRKQRATARSVLMAYCQLSSRNGNAETFDAAVHLVAEIAGVSAASVKRLDYFFKVAGIMDIALVKDERGLDAPRRITLHEEPKAVVETYEEVTADEIRLALPARRERPVAQHVVGIVSDTKERIKENPKETISPFRAKVDYEPRSPKKEREGWEVCKARMAKENDLTPNEVESLCVRYLSDWEADRAAGRVSATSTPEGFARKLPGLIAERYRVEADEQTAHYTAQHERMKKAFAMSVWEAKQVIEAAEKEISRLQGDPSNKEAVSADAPWERRLKPSIATQVRQLQADVRLYGMALTATPETKARMLRNSEAEIGRP